MAVLLGLDIGTTSTIGILIDSEGGTLATASRPSELVSRHATWAEEDPELWWSNACAVTAELLQRTGLSGKDVAAVGVTGMVPAVVLLDRNGRVLRPSLQQNDARATREIEAMQRAFEAERFFRLTGGSINQQLVAPKLRWVERHEPEVFRAIATVFGSYDFIAHRLTGQRAVEHNWALESGLMDFAARRFEPALVAAAGIEPGLLPPIRQSHERIGGVTPAAAAATGLAAGTPVVAGCADHVASAYVAGASEDGDLVLKFGGAGDILLSTAKPVTDPRLFIDYHVIPDHYFSNGCTATAGSLLKWIVQTLAGGEAPKAQAAGLSIYAWLDRLAATVPAGAEGLVLLPYFLGEKTPLHDPYARGTVVGLGLHHGLAHIWRAALEGVIFGFRHHVEVFAERGLAVRRIFACDGGAASDLWLQIAADALGRPVQRIEHHPGSCLGAAYVAGYGAGLVPSLAGVSRYVAGGRVFQPQPALAALYDRRYGDYRETYERLKTLYPKLSHPG
ncbi:carbohydrate kinase [Hypericibacter adhaerens]|jgi:xylulokinase|uniref:Carbohydrate kinase n=1 Tax=Hypericibacter adhaerens TaxID=2602016 RepID=A0A5J6N2R9_9PROT|nr:FGGY-family carbohydrate kinase [Hypericibacter adhaerens]QEX22880.1 carbohydrate kinase [Hypericibacter adhaerens]